jgi:hypothetical protein
MASGSVRSLGRATVTKHETVHRMIELLNAEEARQFSIGLVGYFIEGEPYSADVLTVDGDSTMDLCATDDGFSCFAFFPPERLAPETVAACGVQRGPDGTVFVTVRLEVKLQDVWMIAETVGGQAHTWYSDPAVIATRKLAFLNEQRAWLRPTERREH